MRRYIVILNTVFLHVDEFVEIICHRVRPLRLFTTLGPVPCLFRECEKYRKKLKSILAHKISSLSIPRNLYLLCTTRYAEGEKVEVSIFWFSVYLNILRASSDTFYFDVTFIPLRFQIAFPYAEITEVGIVIWLSRFPFFQDKGVRKRGRFRRSSSCRGFIREICKEKKTLYRDNALAAQQAEVASR